MQMLQKIDAIWEKVERGILSITTVLMSLMLVGNAISRSFFNKSWPFTEEVGKFGIIVLTFMGLGYATRRKMHIEMSGFYDMMPPKVQRIVAIGIQFISALVLLLCTYLAMKYVIHLYDLNQVTTILRVPLYLIMLVIPFGFLLASIQYVVGLIKTILKKAEY